MWFIGAEVEQETSVPPPKKNPGSASALVFLYSRWHKSVTPEHEGLCLLLIWINPMGSFTFPL